MANDQTKPLTLRALMEATGIRDRKTVMGYVRDGCPHHKAPGKTGALTFDLQEVADWMRAAGRPGTPGRPADEILLTRAPAAASVAALPGGSKPAAELTLDEWRELGAIAAVQTKQLEVRKRERQEREAEGELVPLADVQRWWTAQIGALTTALEALPGRIATEAAGRPYEEVYSAAEREVTVMRERLAAEALRG